MFHGIGAVVITALLPVLPFEVRGFVTLLAPEWRMIDLGDLIPFSRAKANNVRLVQSEHRRFSVFSNKNMRESRIERHTE